MPWREGVKQAAHGLLALPYAVVSKHLFYRLDRITGGRIFARFSWYAGIEVYRVFNMPIWHKGHITKTSKNPALL
jgi:hypothetical protein